MFRISDRVSTLALTAVAAMLFTGCSDQPTVPVPAQRAPTLSPRATVTPGTLAVYTDRSAWLAAVAAEGASAQEYDYTGLTMGRITARSVDYGPFRMAVDFLSPNQYNNPGIDIIADASCSLGTGDCNRMLFNMLDPSFTQTYPFDQPKIDSLVMPQPIVAFAATFAQTGVAVGCVTCPEPTGLVTIHFGNVTYVLNDALTAGYGFIGFVAGTPSTTISFTFARTANWANDIIEVYRPEFANASAAETPSQMIGAAETLLFSLNMAKGTATSIDSKLQLALASIAANNGTGACGYLQDALNYISAQTGKKITQGDASTLTGSISGIRTALGC